MRLYDVRLWRAGRPWRRGAALVGLVLCVFLAAQGCSANHKGVLEVSGLIEGVSVDVGSKVGGRVAEVLVAEGDKVKSGDVLVRLERDQAEAGVAAAQAQLDQAEAMLQKVKTGARPEERKQAQAAAAQALQQFEMAKRGFRPQEVDAARAAVRAAQAQRDQASADFERVDRLHASGAVSDQLHDQARHALDGAEANLSAAQKQRDILVTGTREEQVAMAKAAHDQAAAMLEQVETGARAEDIAAAQAMRDVAAANLRLAESNAKEMTIVSPREGVVESMDVHPGDIVKPGAFIRVTDPNDLELVIYVSEATLGFLRLGQEVQFTTDSYGAEAFSAKIIYLASEGEYTPRNLQTQEERVLQMFGVKLKLDSAGGKVKAGMTAVVTLNTSEGGSA